MEIILIYTIYCIIFCMMLHILKNTALLPQKVEVGVVMKGCVYNNSTLTAVDEKFPYLFKSQHLTCQHTRAGDLPIPYLKRLTQGLHQALGIGDSLRW